MVHVEELFPVHPTTLLGFGKDDLENSNDVEEFLEIVGCGVGFVQAVRKALQEVPFWNAEVVNLPPLILISGSNHFYIAPLEITRKKIG